MSTAGQLQGYQANFHSTLPLFNQQLSVNRQQALCVRIAQSACHSCIICAVHHSEGDEIVQESYWRVEYGYGYHTLNFTFTFKQT